MMEATQKLKLSDTFNTVMAKINDIINTIDGKSVKISSDDGVKVVTLTVSNDGHLIATNGDAEGTVLTDFSQN